MITRYCGKSRELTEQAACLLSLALREQSSHYSRLLAFYGRAKRSFHLLSSHSLPTGALPNIFDLEDGDSTDQTILLGEEKTARTVGLDMELMV